MRLLLYMGESSSSSTSVRLTSPSSTSSTSSMGLFALKAKRGDAETPGRTTSCSACIEMPKAIVEYLVRVDKEVHLFPLRCRPDKLTANSAYVVAGIGSFFFFVGKYRSELLSGRSLSQPCNAPNAITCDPSKHFVRRDSEKETSGASAPLIMGKWTRP
jgi:hypothetical protein